MTARRNTPKVLATALQPSAKLKVLVQAGKQALKNTERPSVVEDRGARVIDSAELDGPYAGEQPQANRWDYLLGAKKGTASRIVGLEIHPATPGEIKVVLRKKDWAVATLRQEGVPGVVQQWWWIASGRVRITKTAPQYRALAQSGIRLTGTLLVANCF